MYSGVNLLSLLIQGYISALQHSLHARQVHPRALFVVPYVSVVAEKAAHLEAVLRGTSRIRVRGYHGSDESAQPLAVQ